MSCDLVPVDAYPEIVDDVTLTTRRNIDGSYLEVEETVGRKTTTTFHDRKIAAWAFPGHAEQILVDAISYVPTDEQIEKILKKGNEVVDADDENMDVKDGARKSKDPLKSVWFNRDLGNEVPTRVAEQKKNHYGGDESEFVVAFNREAPMTFDPPSIPSMGMNGILTKFEGNDTNRVNLFVGTEDDVFDLLGRFLRFRCEHEDLIVEQTIEDMRVGGHPSALLDLALAVKNGRKTTFASLGIELHSFCQTWDADTGKPNFSEQSPHFQTKVVVRDPARLFHALREFKGTENAKGLCDAFREYGERVIELKKAFVDKKYAKKFVDVDALYRRMAATREMDESAGLVLAMLGKRLTMV